MFSKWRKQRARKAALARRKAAHAALPDAAAALVEHFPDEIWPGVGKVVAAYCATHSEIDPIRLMETFHCEQARIALPRVDGPDQPLTFHQWQPGDELEIGAHGIAAPKSGAPVLEPELLLVPLVAFDQRGMRLGYGGGYYDRTLAALRAKKSVMAVGIAFEVQGVKKLPTQRHDQPLDWIVTEKRAYRFASK
ncbi:5-formyltetrahydrofolate cyclo-ligase [Hyphobacterium sp.]|uniref:5-formyltetrahydrofolate cyclo-ligase n=1 Tax=Hyphobacterium sp. TaxID=2004662 RepID=UPI003BAABD5F